MKRTLVLMVTLLTMLAFMSGVMAQSPAKTEKSSSSEKAARSPEKAKPGSQMRRFGGAVTGYEAGKMIKVTRSNGKEMTFNLTGATKIKGEVKKGVLVTILYKKAGDHTVATDIIVPTGKKVPKKALEKAAEKPPEKK